MADAPHMPPNDNQPQEGAATEPKKPCKAACVDSLIAQLCASHGDKAATGAPQCMGCPIFRGLATTIITLAYVMLVAFVKDFRHDVSTLWHALYGAEIALALLLGATSLVASSLLMAPDCYGKKWFIVIPYVLFVVLLTICVGRCALEEHLMHLHAALVSECWTNVIVFGVLPIGVAVFWARRGATVYPKQLAILQAIGVGAIGWIGQRLTVPVDDPHYVYLAQWVPVIVVGAVFGLVARRLYKW